MLARLRLLAEQTSVPRIAALAHVDIGNIHAGVGDKTKLTQAAAQYNLVIANFPEQGVAVARAHYGLAKLAEGHGRFEEAQKHYDAIKALAGKPNSPIRGLPIVAAAKANAKALKALLRDVPLVPKSN